MSNSKEIIKESKESKVVLCYLDNGQKEINKTFLSKTILEKEVYYASLLNTSLEFQQEGNVLTYPYCISLDKQLSTPQSDKNAQTLIAQIITILKDLYSNNVVHRDIKAGNIYFNEDHQLRLADFETVLDDDSQNTCGTPGIMAPEQYTNTNVDWRADQYAAGIICYRVLTGCMPFKEDSHQAYLKVQSQSPPDPSIVNIKLKKPICDIVIKMLEPNPADRFSTPQEIEDALKNASEVAQRPILETKTIAINSTPKKVPLNKLYLLALILFLALFILIFKQL